MSRSPSPHLLPCFQTTHKVGVGSSVTAPDRRHVRASGPAHSAWAGWGCVRTRVDVDEVFGRFSVKVGQLLLGARENSMSLPPSNFPGAQAAAPFGHGAWGAAGAGANHHDVGARGWHRSCCRTGPITAPCRRSSGRTCWTHPPGLPVVFQHAFDGQRHCCSRGARRCEGWRSNTAAHGGCYRPRPGRL